MASQSCERDEIVKGIARVVLGWPQRGKLNGRERTSEVEVDATAQSS